MKALRWFTLMQLAGMLSGLLIVWVAVAYAFHDQHWWLWVDVTLDVLALYLTCALGAWWGLRAAERQRTAQATALAASGMTHCPTCSRPTAAQTTDNGVGPAGGLADLTDVAD